MRLSLLMLFPIFLLKAFESQSIEVDMQAPKILTHNDSTYFNNVLHDSLVSYYYIAFDIKAPDYVGRVTIQVFELGYFFAKTRKKDLPNYKQIMRELLFQGDTLITSVPIYKEKQTEYGPAYEYGFSKVTTNAEVERLASEGKEAFLDYFFIREGNQGIFNDKLFKGLDLMTIHSLKTAVINQLFEWRIYTTDKGLPSTFRFSLDDSSIQRELERLDIQRRLERGEKVIIQGKP